MPERPADVKKRQPSPEAVAAAHDAMLLVVDDAPLPAIATPPAEQPSDRGYDLYDI